MTTHPLVTGLLGQLRQATLSMVLVLTGFHGADMLMAPTPIPRGPWSNPSWQEVRIPADQLQTQRIMHVMQQVCPRVLRQDRQRCPDAGSRPDQQGEDLQVVVLKNLPQDQTARVLLDTRWHPAGLVDLSTPLRTHSVKRIEISETLARSDDDEIAHVLAHELEHVNQLDRADDLVAMDIERHRELAALEQAEDQWIDQHDQTASSAHRAQQVVAQLRGAEQIDRATLARELVTDCTVLLQGYRIERLDGGTYYLRNVAPDLEPRRSADFCQLLLD